MVENKVDYSLSVILFKIDEHRPSTRQVVEAIKDEKNLGVVSGISYLHYDHWDLREIGEFLEKGLIKGLKFYPGYEPSSLNNTLLKLWCEMAVKYDVPVMFHSGDTYGRTGKVNYTSLSNMESYLKFMNQLELADDKKELILWKNAAELFKNGVKNL